MAAELPSLKNTEPVIRNRKHFQPFCAGSFCFAFVNVKLTKNISLNE